MRRLLRKFLGDSKGATAVEFAMVSLPFFGMVFGMIQLGIIFLSNQTLDNAVDRAARLVQTGQVDRNGINESGLRAQVCSTVFVFGSCDSVLQLSVDSFPDFASINPDSLFTTTGRPIISGNYNPGNGGDIVVINASISMPIVIGSVFFGTGPDNRTELTTSAVFANERF